MKRLLVILMIACAGASLIIATSAEARRLGGGRSIGTQRQATPPREAPKAPAAQPNQPAQQSAAAPAGAAARPVAAGGMSRWLAPLAAFGLGAALMSMFGGSALMGAIANAVMIALLIAAVLFVIRLMRRKTEPAASSLRYAGVPGALSLPGSQDMAAGGSGPAPAQSTAAYPAGFDAEGFLRQAKVSFIRLQAANDAGDLGDIRDYTTPELYAELAMQISERAGAAQKTEVLMLNAELLEVVEEADRGVASVRFTGLLREEEGAEALTIDETWHVVKDLRNPRATWLMAGIQQNA